MKHIIYGAGFIGRTLYNTIIQSGEKVAFFIDEFTDKKEIFNVKIKKISEVEKEEKSLKVYVTVSVDEVSKTLLNNGFLHVVTIYEAKKEYKYFYKHYLDAKKEDAQAFKQRQKEYFGNSHQCPLCKSSLKEFLDGGIKADFFKRYKIIGGGYRKNATCPVCRASDRERLLYFYLSNKTNFFVMELKLLHVAPESSLRKIIGKHKNITYTTADFYRIDVDVNMDITDIAYQDNSFDVVICSHVLEHVIDDKKAMGEIYRVLNKKGWAILNVPQKEGETYEDFSIADPKARLEHFGQEDHVRIYGDNYKQRLQSIGFSVEEISYDDICNAKEQELMGVGEKAGKIFVCRKI